MGESIFAGPVFMLGIIGITVEKCTTGLSIGKTAPLERTMRILQSQIKLSVQRSILRMNAERYTHGRGPSHCFTRTSLRRMCSAMFLTYQEPHRQAQTLHSIAPLPSRFSSLRRYPVLAARQGPAPSTQQTSAEVPAHSLLRSH